VESLVSTKDDTKALSGDLSFASLPGELRNRIYALVINKPEQVPIVGYTHPQDAARAILRSPIFRLNHQIQSEALAFLCTQQHFVIVGHKSLETFLEVIGSSGRQNLNFITFLPEGNFEVIALRSCPNLLREATRLRQFHLKLSAPPALLREAGSLTHDLIYAGHGQTQTFTNTFPLGGLMHLRETVEATGGKFTWEWVDRAENLRSDSSSSWNQAYRTTLREVFVALGESNRGSPLKVVKGAVLSASERERREWIRRMEAAASVWDDHLTR
jgi:hypothetical protein